METREAKKLDDYYRIASEIIELRKDQLARTKATGFSMYPAIISGDEIAIDSSRNRDLAVGDIIVFERGNSIICHRIARITDIDGQKRYITQGDARKSPDEGTIISEQVIGKVSYLMRGKTRIDPYAISGSVYSPLFIERLLALVRIRLYYSYLTLAGLVKKALILLNIYSLFKPIINGIMRRGVSYFLLLPRQASTAGLYKYICIPREEVIYQDSGFFEPLNFISKFKIVADIGRTRLAEMELIRYANNADKAGTWVVISYT